MRRALEELQDRVHELTRDDQAKALAGGALERALQQKSALLDQVPGESVFAVLQGPSVIAKHHPSIIVVLISCWSI